ncbi:MAG: tetratricopeptide repeat protein [Helicobacteraceae bacterium]|jgi:Flp pilus assembly protein TadD|nr:tetratricopeptide repeat protein [Helicobacteraceae bacterium]
MNGYANFMRLFILSALLGVFALAGNVAVDRGIAAYESGNFQEAIRQFSIAIRENPKNALSYIGRGIAYDDLGDTNKAIADFNQAKLDPNYANA